jgi:undecaprenyl-diphosphatase
MISEEARAAILGCIQGITEFFPISSSAHLIVFRDALGFEGHGLPFDISVHLATLLAVLIYFRREILEVLTGPEAAPVLLRVAIATLPSVALGLALKEHRETLSRWFEVGGWTVSGTYLLFTRGVDGDLRYARLPIPRALLVGMAQAMAIFPGISRSGSSISAGLWLGLERTQAARFSFLLAIPAILGAAILSGLDLLESSGGERERLWRSASIAMPAAFVTGMIAIHFLLRIVRGDRFHLFGIYNLMAAAVFAAYLLLGA